MFSRFVLDRPAFISRLTPATLSALFLSFVLAAPLLAQEAPKVTIGAGLRSSFTHDEPDSGTSTDKFSLNSARLYVNGPVTDNVKFMFNTEYDGGTNKVGVLDAIGRFEYSPMFNIWAGRLLPPSDRANLNGPYYSSHWNVYQDGLENGHPAVFQGRDNGIVYWGDFAKGHLKFAGGGFDGATADGNPSVLGAARVQINFWDPEGGYYLNGTYYGAKKMLSLAGSIQGQSGNTATTVDLLFERKLPDGSVVTIESEYANYNKLGGYDSNYTSDAGASILGAYILPKPVGPGKFQILGRYADAQFRQGVIIAAKPYNQKTTEVNLNYLLKEFNARIMFFYLNKDYSAVKTNTWQTGVGLQIQM
jgi:hypothetical protein